jgi:hypothetical protein
MSDEENFPSEKSKMHKNLKNQLKPLFSFRTVFTE